MIRAVTMDQALEPSFCHDCRFISLLGSLYLQFLAQQLFMCSVFLLAVPYTGAGVAWGSLAGVSHLNTLVPDVV